MSGEYDTDFREHPEAYRYSPDEKGVFKVEPYKSELLPLWRYRNEEAARESSKAILERYAAYREEEDFVGMDMARKYLQMGFTRSMRYAKYPGGRKYDDEGKIREAQTWADPEKRAAALVYKEALDEVRADEAYERLKARHLERVEGSVRTEESRPPVSAGARFGAALIRGVSSLGRGVATAFQMIDPDLRQHGYELPLVGLSLLVPGPGAVEALPVDGHRPVLFVHGLGGNPRNFFGLKTYFANRGRTRTYTVVFDTCESIETMAKTLSAVIAAVIEKNELPAENAVDLVCHSMGGLIARIAMESQETRRAVHHLLTLGTPHGGSHLARLATSPLLLELRPGSKTLCRLDAQSFWGEPGSPRITSLWSRGDTIVLPAESAIYPYAENIEIEGATHYGYLISPRIWRKIYNLLYSLPEEERGRRGPKD